MIIAHNIYKSPNLYSSGFVHSGLLLNYAGRGTRFNMYHIYLSYLGTVWRFQGKYSTLKNLL